MRTPTLGTHEILCYNGSFRKCSEKPEEGESNGIWGQPEGFMEEEKQQEEEAQEGGKARSCRRWSPKPALSSERVKSEEAKRSRTPLECTRGPK